MKQIIINMKINEAFNEYFYLKTVNFIMNIYNIFFCSLILIFL